ncbi:MAG: class I SAM-dependent methyltransferase [Chloroflexota bacterium]
MEYVACDLCGADDSEELFIGRDEWYGRSGTFPTVRCRQCGLIYVNPRPDPKTIGHYYPADYAPYFLAVEDEPSWWQRLNRRLALRKRLRLIQRHLPRPGRVLDVGCATGSFLVTLREAGWQVQGVEFNSQAADYARRRHGLDVVTGTLADGRFPDNQFDLVIFWDVLEHVHGPRQTLLEAARITRPGGTLLLVLPNPDSLEATWFGSQWAGWDTPRHLYIYSRPVLHRFLSETGWQMGATSCITGRIWLFNLSLAHWLQNRVKNSSVRRVIMTIMRSLPIRILSLPFFMTVERLQKGSVMAVFAHRIADHDHNN